LLTAGRDPHYALGLAPALADAGIQLDVVGNSEMEAFPKLKHPNIRFFNLRGDQRDTASALEKLRRVLSYYAALFRFGAQSQSQIFHVLWPNKFVYFDRTVLNFYYRCLGKKLVFTAHNVNTEERDQRDSALNRLTLRMQFNLMDFVFVHTPAMQEQIMKTYGVTKEKITALTFPINNVTPRTAIGRDAARLKLRLPAQKKTILFFGNIARYKGLDDLIRALPELKSRLGTFRILVAGGVKKGEECYLKQVQQLAEELEVSDVLDFRIDYIPENEVELYFKAADLLVLPYKMIFQSGVLFLSYSFGLPVVATDAGSLRNDVVEGKTGFVSRCDDPADLAAQICRYFQNELFSTLESKRDWIIDYANKTYSWNELAGKTREVYESLLAREVSRP